MEQMYQELGKGINPYGLDYPRCLEPRHEHRRMEVTLSESSAEQQPEQVSRQTQMIISSQVSQLMNHTAQAVAETNYEDDPPFLPPKDHYRPCAEEHLDTYLNRADVVEAIHANPKTLPWRACSNRVEYSRDDNLNPVVDLYRDLLKSADRGDVNLKIMIFSGDDDSVCSLVGTQTWIWDLGVKARGRDTWNPWTVEKQTAGFVTQFHLDNPDSSFVFVTVRGAGHEVPAYRPMEALELLIHYLNDDWSKK